MLKAAWFEEKIYREVEKVEEGSHQREMRVKILPICGGKEGKV
jgi:hypothetical protein